MQQFGLFITSLIIWSILTWIPSAEEMSFGVVISIIIAFAFNDLFSHNPIQILHPRRLFYTLLYAPVFLFYCMLANFDVAYRVLHPKLPIHPGIVRAKTTLTTDVARAFLANSISLTPGTTTVDIIDDNIYIHWLNVTTTDTDEITKKLVTRFEYFLKRIFE
ncbi:MAG: Na+/H+ antiporter subunit E [Candidatus Saganbacteria bacterium]|nr:Na+/H+ antiporter subunit E [Candidatus Saganbacteria bacterium]